MQADVELAIAGWACVRKVCEDPIQKQSWPMKVLFPACGSVKSCIGLGTLRLLSRQSSSSSCFCLQILFCSGFGRGSGSSQHLCFLVLLFCRLADPRAFAFALGLPACCRRVVAFTCGTACSGSGTGSRGGGSKAGKATKPRPSHMSPDMSKASKGSMKQHSSVQNGRTGGRAMEGQNPNHT